jgi:hypothetical protein
MGNPFGRPSDKVQQRQILIDALQALESMKAAGEILDLPYEWGDEFAMNLGSGYRAKSA